VWGIFGKDCKSERWSRVDISDGSNGSVFDSEVSVGLICRVSRLLVVPVMGVRGLLGPASVSACGCGGSTIGLTGIGYVKLVVRSGFEPNSQRL